MKYYESLVFNTFGDYPESQGIAKDGVFHGYYGIQYNHSGPLLYSRNDEPEIAAEGAYAFFTYPGPYFRYGALPGTRRHHCFICFSGTLVRRFIAGGLLDLKRRSPLIQVVYSERFYSVFRKLTELLQQPGGALRPRAGWMLEDLLLQLQEQPAAPDKLYSHYVTALLTLRDRIAMNPLKEWDFRQEARRMELSYVHFRRIFKQATAWPPGAFLLECRLRHAEKLLMTSHARVSEIAQDCGFRDAYHFSRIFRKHCGHSPAEFRKLFGCQ